ncbi:hypothetical protein P153DRAFT_433002 [Dothidotthia symphoricarpi CBS 119687]|uniref:Uncharacterized protein n=1 Tax=Dothidotthia symphoricarpi CBS 119687 TaxID=1392245 RepID=A0A6A6A5B2_9PLEO|nr:uncharacterized protein P153DRAFT_433002 [Dothidotthia symphoricarpi CBS 119687]KAF2127182.1 hypothetical protein P153DRAFT_433002 [Dothidotthia symphoricarpi CBS 119687]
MQLSRQTHLGSIDTKLLTIVDLQGPPVWPCTIIQSEEAYILHRLPDELLLLIVKFSLYTNDRTTRETTRETWALFEDVRACDTSCIMALSQVCHRFKRIAQPLLFSNIGFMHPNQVLPPSIRVLRLHRTLSDRVDLRQHCRYLTINMGDVARREARTLGYYSVARDFVTWFANTKYLSIHDSQCSTHGAAESDESGAHGSNSETCAWDLYRYAVDKLECVEYAYIDRAHCRIQLNQMIESLGFPKLKKLELIRVHLDGHVELEAKKHRTAPFTHLHLFNTVLTARATYILLQWPRVLTHFVFDAYPYQPPFVDYPTLESWLLIHAETLVHIKISCLHPKRSKRLLNATLFPQLELLSLSRWQMQSGLRTDHSTSVRTDQVNLLGSSLKIFCWDFTIEDSELSRLPFGDDEASWIRTLSERAFEHKAALETIKILYSLDDHHRTRSKGYPWECMEDAQRHLVKFGIELIYDKPPMSKDEWTRYYETGIAPYADFWGPRVHYQPPRESTLEEDEAERRLDAEYDELMRQGLYHGEDIRRYLGA